jgi:hypothetical protein
MASNLQQLDHDPLKHLEGDEAATALSRHAALSGCFTIIGPVQICYSTSGSGFRVCLKLAGIEVTCITVDPSNPCGTLSGNVLLAKASIEVCLKGTCLTYSAQACYRVLPWQDWTCVSDSGNIICF